MNYKTKYYRELRKSEVNFVITLCILFICCVMCASFAIRSIIEQSLIQTIDMFDVEPEDITVMPKPVAVEVKMEEVEQDEIYCLTSKSFINNRGIEVLTSEVEINMTTLHIDEAFESPTWDTKGKIKDVEIIWDFLVNQQSVHPNIASGIIGCLYHEGTFGEQQGSKNFIDSIDEARLLLNKNANSTGFGIAQWTYSNRRELLLKYYEEAYLIYPDDSYRASIVAELCCLIEELKGYNIFEDLSSVHSVEDATGRFAKLYECYFGSEDDWMKCNGSYKIACKDKSATMRLQTAYNVYNYFMND